VLSQDILEHLSTNTAITIDGVDANSIMTATDGHLKDSIVTQGSKVLGTTNKNGQIIDDKGHIVDTSKLADKDHAISFSGGTDTFTGQKFSGVIESKVGNTVATPITTLMSAGASAEDIKAALHIDSSVDLSKFDPFAKMQSSNPETAAAAQHVFTVQQQVATITEAIRAVAESQGGDIAAAKTALAQTITSAATTARASEASYEAAKQAAEKAGTPPPAKPSTDDITAQIKDTLHSATTSAVSAVLPKDPDESEAVHAAKVAAISHTVNLVNDNIQSTYSKADPSSFTEYKEGETHSQASNAGAFSQNALDAIKDLAETKDEGLLHQVTTATTPAALASRISIPCYVQGTHIETEQGPKLVEDLVVGDLIKTVDGRFEPVIWIGSRSLIPLFQVKKDKCYPVRIVKDAFGEGLPSADLWLSPDHSLYVDGVMIPADKLINGKTIFQEKWAQVTYFHVELPKHEAIYAEGLPAETYLDTSETNRAFFNQNQGDATVFGVADQMPTPKDVPIWRHIWDTQGYGKLHTSGPVVDAVQARLDARIEEIKAGEKLKAKDLIAA